MEDDRHCIGVIPEIGQLIVHVSVVGVDRNEGGLVAGIDALHVLRGVEEVESDLVLVLSTSTKQSRPEANAPLIEGGPTPNGVAVLQRWRVGNSLPARLATNVSA